MTDGASNITVIACSIFREELEALRREGKFEFPAVYMDSMLHMDPGRLQETLDAAVKKVVGPGGKALLLYGDCSPYMHELAENKSVARVGGINCINIFLEEDTYRSLRKEGAFFLMREWAVRWREVFEVELGLNAENAKSFMREMHTKLVYIDTGMAEVPAGVLKEISEFCGLECEVLKVSSDGLLKRIKRSAEELMK